MGSLIPRAVGVSRLERGVRAVILGGFVVGAGTSGTRYYLDSGGESLAPRLVIRGGFVESLVFVACLRECDFMGRGKDWYPSFLPM